MTERELLEALEIWITKGRQPKRVREFLLVLQSWMVQRIERLSDLEERMIRPMDDISEWVDNDDGGLSYGPVISWKPGVNEEVLLNGRFGIKRLRAIVHYIDRKLG